MATVSSTRVMTVAKVCDNFDENCCFVVDFTAEKDLIDDITPF